MARTNDTGKNDLDDGIVAQLTECGLHAQDITDVEGGNWA